MTSIFSLARLVLIGVTSSCALSLAASAADVAKPDADALVLSPENTIILEGPGASGRSLQYNLLKYYVSPEAAAKFPMQGTMDRSTSAAFPILKDVATLKLPEGKSIIAVGNSRYLSPEDRKRLADSPGSMLLKRQENVVVIAGDPLDSVSTFLNRVAGLRFYAPDEIWTSRPRGNQMSVTALDFFRPRLFATAWFAPFKERNREWLQMNPGAGRLTITAGHNLANIFPPEKYEKTHPEIYEMRGGERRVPLSIGTKIWNPCLSARALPDLAMDYIRERMSKAPLPTFISMGMMDIPFECDCPECQNSVKAHRGSYSNLYYTFLNEVARRCQKEFPGLQISSLIYVNAKRPPEGMRIESNIVVKVVTKTYRFGEPAALAAEQERIRTFSDLGARWMIHDWCFSGVSPRSYMRQYAVFLQWAHQHGMLGAYIEFTAGESWYLDGAKYWILAQLMTDPYQDVDLLWKQYCDDMFGPAGETMFRFHQHFQEKFIYSPSHISVDDLPRQESALYDEADLALERSLLESALAQTRNDPLIQERLAKIMRYFRGHELFALATHTPHRLEWEFRGKDGVNKDLLGFYIKDDGKRIDEALRFYLEQRTVAPDDNETETRLGMTASYVDNYIHGLASLLKAIRSQALGNADLSHVDQPAIKALVERTHAVLHENLPPNAAPDRVKLFEDILARQLWVPTVAQMPKIDGDLRDPAWAGAAELSGFTDQDTLRVPVHVTTGKVMRVGDKLLVGLVCQQKGEIWAQSPADTLTGTHIWRESGVEIFYGPTNPEPGTEKPPYAQYVINSLGAYRGFGEAKDNREGVEVSVVLNREKNEFTIEASLPLKTGAYDYTALKAMTFNVHRLVYTRNSYVADVMTGWHPVFITGSDVASRGLIFMK